LQVGALGQLSKRGFGANITAKFAEPRMTPDKTRLVNESYANDEPLSVRIETHRHYSVPPVDLPMWALDRYAWRGNETVLDIGTGTGQYLAPLRQRIPRGRIVAGDLAPGMLRDLKAKGVPGGALLLNADAEALPLASASCDVVLASYVLFFVPDIPRALAEMQRILKPGGVLLAVTMAEAYTDELRRLLYIAAEKVGVSGSPNWLKLHQRFNLTNGVDYLAPHFQVAKQQHESALVFPSVEPVLTYVNSMRDSMRDDLPPHRTWDDFLAALREEVEAEIAAHGEFRVSKPAGVLIAVRRPQAADCK
jgi:ubiquinone/menaquinone biosynthesis C-methylase UbiE